MVNQFIFQTMVNDTPMYLQYWPGLSQQSGRPEPTMTAYAELAYRADTLLEAARMCLWFTAIDNAITGRYDWDLVEFEFESTDVPSLDYLRHRGPLTTQGRKLSTKQNKQFFELLVANKQYYYETLKNYGKMEEINNKAFEDEFNKSEATIEDGRETDKMPLPGEILKKRKEVEKRSEIDNQNSNEIN